MSIISVNGLTFKYPQSKKNAVDDLSFAIEKGSYTAIIGYNGSGKSSLARLLCGLENPSGGSIEVEEGNRIGIVFQSPKDQIVSGIVSRDTAFGPQNLGLTKSEVELRTIESLNIVDMLDRASSSTSALSLGQTQKIALSGVIALRPEILILDEAVSMLDPLSRKDILEFVAYWHKCGNTIIQITHDIEVVKEADTVIGMENGKIFFYGTKNAFLANPQNVFRIDGMPLEKTDKNLLCKNKQISLSVRNLNFSYDKEMKKCGVKNINFDLYKGTITALTGPSGAGKSTILELCAGLLTPDMKDENKTSIQSLSRPLLAQQNSKTALFETFAADDVAFGPINQGKDGKELKSLVVKAMNTAFLPFEEFGERRTFALSGGEQRRLSIAGIIAMNSDILFFDEPSAGLDSKARFQIMQMFRTLADEGKTIMFSTHKKEEADFADREIKVKNGIIVEDSFKSEICKSAGVQKNDDELSESKPYSCIGLLESLRKISAGLSGAKKSKKSLVEKLSPALRIILFLVIFAFSLAVKKTGFAALLLVCSIVYCLFCDFSLKKLCKAFIKILPFLLFFSVFQLIFHQALPDEVRFTTWKWFMITPSKLIFCLTTILRTYASLACISAFFVSTPDYDLIEGLKVLLTPLALLKVPVRYFILIMEIIFRFVPLLVDEASSIIKTQIIRGGLGKVKGGFAKIRALIPLTVPLLIQSIKKSEALADAITMRCFK